MHTASWMLAGLSAAADLEPDDHVLHVENVDRLSATRMGNVLFTFQPRQAIVEAQQASFRVCHSPVFPSAQVERVGQALIASGTRLPHGRLFLA